MACGGGCGGCSVGSEDAYRRWARWLVGGANLLYAARLLAGLASLAEARAGRPVGWVVALIGVALTLWLTGAGLDALLAARDRPDEEEWR